MTPGHPSLLGRRLDTLRVGEGWDLKEKLFRNTMGAFSTSSNLQVPPPPPPTPTPQVLATFGPAVSKAGLVQVGGGWEEEQ